MHLNSDSSKWFTDRQRRGQVYQVARKPHYRWTIKLGRLHIGIWRIK